MHIPGDLKEPSSLQGVTHLPVSHADIESRLKTLLVSIQHRWINFPKCSWFMIQRNKTTAGMTPSPKMLMLHPQLGISRISTNLANLQPAKWQPSLVLPQPFGPCPRHRAQPAIQSATPAAARPSALARSAKFRRWATPVVEPSAGRLRLAKRRGEAWLEDDEAYKNDSP